MLKTKTYVLPPFAVKIFTGEDGDSLLLSDYVKDQIGVKRTPGDEKKYSDDSDIFIGCIHAIIEGKSFFRGIEKETGDGGWFYMPEDITTTPITCEEKTSLLMIEHIEKRFISNRQIHNLTSSESIEILPSDFRQKYIYLATGSVTINSNIEVVSPKMLLIKNPAAITAGENSILMELEV